MCYFFPIVLRVGKYLLHLNYLLILNTSPLFYPSNKNTISRKLYNSSICFYLLILLIFSFNVCCLSNWDMTFQDKYSWFQYGNEWRTMFGLFISVGLWVRIPHSPGNARKNEIWKEKIGRKSITEDNGRHEDEVMTLAQKCV